MVPRLKEINALVSDEVDQPVLLRHASRPASVKVELERLWFPDAVKRIPENGLYEIQDSKSGPAFRPNPPAQVLSKLGVVDGKACFGCSRGLTCLQVPDSGEAVPATTG